MPAVALYPAPPLPLLLPAEISTRRFGVLRRFTTEELAGACDNFGDDNYLGEGAFSCVYKGVLENGAVVAIKKLKVSLAPTPLVSASCHPRGSMSTALASFFPFLMKRVTMGEVQQAE